MPEALQKLPGSLLEPFRGAKKYPKPLTILKEVPPGPPLTKAVLNVDNLIVDALLRKSLFSNSVGRCEIIENSLASLWSTFREVSDGGDTDFKEGGGATDFKEGGGSLGASIASSSLLLT